MDNVVNFPRAPEWASKVDAEMLDLLIAKGYLQHRQRRNWCAVEAAINKAFYAAVYDARPELSLQEVIVRMLQDAARR